MLKKILLSLAIAGALVGVTQPVNAAVAGPYIGGQLGYASTHNSASDMPGPNVNTIINGLSALPWDSTATTNSDANSEGGAGRLFVGYQFNQNWAAEVGYSKFTNIEQNGSFTGSSANSFSLDSDNVNVVNSLQYNYASVIKEQAFDLMGKGILPLESGFGLYGKLGVAYVIREITRTDTLTSGLSAADSEGEFNVAVNYPSTVGTYSETDRRFMPAAAVGVSYDITKNIPLDISWTHMQKVGGNIPNIDMVSFGLAYNFG